ncbi:MAG: DUF2799 domain-containing protein [Gammaproteobacteria bacterium]|nr:DUF2799 domain-containing protein [Gammaproteobacteria bacterium]MDH3432153.1 DUF2799 domain-containing protein [Gammaproteobacteria bacterium]MDH3433195.1 DUF2799 domain-containing protein [Gammaproteobacteria bacterium]
MDNQRTSIFVACLLVGLSGCASMNADECAASDWSAIGYEDGARGYTTEQFSGRRKACAKHGITADFQAYQRGREQGLEAFCQPGRAFSFGANGGRYNGVCAADMEPQFLDAYNAGHKLYRLRANVNSANSAIYSKEQELDYAENRITAVELALISSDTTSEERIALLVELKDLSERTGELEVEIDMLIADRARFEQDLQYYEQTVAAYGY